MEMVNMKLLTRRGLWGARLRNGEVARAYVTMVSDGYEVYVWPRSKSLVFQWQNWYPRRCEIHTHHTRLVSARHGRAS
jgi:endonuclease I